MAVLAELRDSCLDCVRKHLAQAYVLMSEAHQGYALHRWIAIGHLAEASEECVKEHPQLAARIRTHRLRYMADPDYVVPIMALIDMATQLVDEDADVECTLTEAKLSSAQKTALQKLTDTFGQAEFLYDPIQYGGGTAYLGKGKKTKTVRVNNRTMDSLVRKGLVKHIQKPTDDLLPHEKGYVGKRTFAVVSEEIASNTLYQRILPEANVDVAGVLITNTKTDKKLLLKRKDGRWDITKGHVDKGEKPKKAARREAGEESGLKPKVGDRFVDVRNKKGKVVRVYSGETDKKNVVTQPDEHTKHKWVGTRRALKLLKPSPHLAKAVKQLAGAD